MFIRYVMCDFVDRELTTTKRKMESDVSSQCSVIEESKSRITMLENILAKEAVVCHKLLTRPTQSPTLNGIVAYGL